MVTRNDKFMYIIQLTLHICVYFYYIVCSAKIYITFSLTEMTEIALKILMTVFYLNCLLYDRSRFRQLYFYLKKIEILNTKLKEARIEINYRIVKKVCILFIFIKYAFMFTILVNDLCNSREEIIDIVLFNLVSVTDMLTECQLMYSLLNIYKTFEVLTRNTNQTNYIFLAKYYGYLCEVSNNVNQLCL